MYPLLIGVFVIGYAVIAMEHTLKVHKTAASLLMAVVLWTIFILGNDDPHQVNESLSRHLASIGEIVIFLLGAMTIVELVNTYRGFDVITSRIKTNNPRKLMWVVAWLTFFLSAVLDNLTTSLVMISLLKQLVPELKMRRWFATMVIVAANAGGAWSPIGDVTNTMLWIDEKISTGAIVTQAFVPSILALLVPLLLLTFLPLGIDWKKNSPESDDDWCVLPSAHKPDYPGSKLIFGLGVGALLFVPIFKTLTHLPPYVGILFGLSILWLVADWLHENGQLRGKPRPPQALRALARVDASSILFFLGILTAVGALESAGILGQLANALDKTLGSHPLIMLVIGGISAVVDNVPMVAAALGMYDGAGFAMDHPLWIFLAFCAGTGGSMLIIGSAAGVAVMGLEKIDFFWYAKRVSWMILLGYLAGAASYLLMFGYQW